MNFLRIILLPTVPVYALLIRVRNFLFDKKIFKSKKVNGRIISVGNITVGGSGKTPATIYITELLKKNGINVGVLSRGYRRKSRGYVLVSDGKDILAPVDKSGDEMYHTVLDCKAPAAVCENRVLGAKKLINDTGVNTIVLDDAFQHRWIYRDLDIVVIEQRFLTDENFLVKSLLLSGTMREPLSSLRRADAVVINRKFTTLKNIPEKFSKYFSDIKVFNGFYEAVGFYDLKSNTQFGLNEFEGQKSLVVSGIAKPYSFLNVLSQTKVDTENRLIFRDHKHYTHKDIQMIRKAFYSTNSHSVVTTEKDAVKLTDFSKELDDIDIYFLKIKFKMDDEDSFKGFIFRA